MEPQAYNFVNIHDHEISAWKFLSRLLHGGEPHIGGIDRDVQSNLPTLTLKNG